MKAEHYKKPVEKTCDGGYLIPAGDGTAYLQRGGPKSASEKPLWIGERIILHLCSLVHRTDGLLDEWTRGAEQCEKNAAACEEANQMGKSMAWTARAEQLFECADELRETLTEVG